MAMTDPLGDMLTRIRNGQRAKKDSVLSPASKLRANVLEVLQREGYIRGYSEDASAKHKATADRTEIFRGRTCYQARRARLQAGPPRLFGFSKELPIVRNGLGITIVSTPKGVLSDAEARETTSAAKCWRRCSDEPHRQKPVRSPVGSLPTSRQHAEREGAQGLSRWVCPT